MSPSAPTNTLAASTRDSKLWEATLVALADDDEDKQLYALRLLATLDDADLPIEAIVAQVLIDTTDHDGTLYFTTDSPFWEEGIEALARAPERLPLDLVRARLVAAFEHATDTDQMLDFIENFVGEIATGPFIELLQATQPSLRRAGLEALYKLNTMTLMLPLLEDADPQVRALAIENIWLLHGMTRDRLQQLADDQEQPQEARDMATYYLNSTPVSS